MVTGTSIWDTWFYPDLWVKCQRCGTMNYIRTDKCRKCGHELMERNEGRTMTNEDRIRLLEKRVEKLERAAQYNPFIGLRELPGDEEALKEQARKTVKLLHDLDEEKIK